MKCEHQNPESAGRRYLRYLLHRSHEIDVPYLPIEHLTDRSVHDWIDYLRPRVEIIDAVNAQLAEEGNDAIPLKTKTFAVANACPSAYNGWTVL